ncbi:hypothetical protein SUGI_0362170 [Cryptomeria japonica]|nr:hypothetical protein SUGI_0362170 [Cryptomeria japonica]
MPIFCAVSIFCRGKTTLVLAVCNDHQIREYFDNNVILITVSESPNLKGIFGTLWKKLAGRTTQEFQNLEDAHMQLKQLISRQTKQTVLILDNVCSSADLEYLLFDGPEFRTLITTRDNSIIPSTLSTKLYRLPLLCQQDALSLFCFWAFGQTSIPSTANANLVKQTSHVLLFLQRENVYVTSMQYCIIVSSSSSLKTLSCRHE